MLGKLIPAGTGMKRYRSVKLDSEEYMISNDDVLDFGESDESMEEGTADQQIEADAQTAMSEDAVAYVDSVESDGISE